VPKLLTVGECAARLGVSRSLCYQYAASGLIPVVRLPGKTIRIPEDAFSEWLKRQTSVPTTRPDLCDE